MPATTPLIAIRGGVGGGGSVGGDGVTLNGPSVRDLVSLGRVFVLQLTTTDLSPTLTFSNTCPDMPAKLHVKIYVYNSSLLLHDTGRILPSLHVQVATIVVLKNTCTSLPAI